MFSVYLIYVNFIFILKKTEKSKHLKKMLFKTGQQNEKKKKNSKCKNTQ